MVEAVSDFNELRPGKRKEREEEQAALSWTRSWQAAEKRSLNLQVSSFKSQLPRIWPDFGGSDLSLVT